MWPFHSHEWLLVDRRSSQLKGIIAFAGLNDTLASSGGHPVTQKVIQSFPHGLAFATGELAIGDQYFVYVWRAPAPMVQCA